MKTISMADAQTDLQGLLDAAQKERIVVRRNGKPSVMLLGIEAYDQEDLDLASSADFWRLIEKRRKGNLIPLAAVKARLKLQKRPDSAPGKLSSSKMEKPRTRRRSTQR
jgi:prevent-host-death family protein